jgi:tetratricopeptide (TPR) repeat protein
MLYMKLCASKPGVNQSLSLCRQLDPGPASPYHTHAMLAFHPPSSFSRYRRILSLFAAFFFVGCGADQEAIDSLVANGKSLYQLGQFAEALVTLDSAALQRPDDVDIPLYLARCYVYLSKYDEAKTEIDRALALSPADWRLHEVLGIIHTARYTSRAYTESQQRDGNAAIAAFHAAISLDSLRAGPQYNLGIMYSYRDSTALAQKAFMAALRVDSTFAAAHKKVGLIYREQGFQQEALAALQNAVRYAPDDSESHFNLGLAYRDIGEFDQAVTHLERARELNPVSIKIQLNLGNVYMRVGRREDGRAVLKKAESLRQQLAQLGSEVTPPSSKSVSIGSARDHYHMALAHVYAGRPAEAIVEFRRSIEINPDRKDPRSGLGTLLLEGGQPQQALEHLRRAVELDDTDPITHMRLGWAYKALQRPAEARSAFAAAARLDTGLAEAPLNLGLVSFALGEIEESVGHFERAVVLSPTDAKSHVNLGVALVELGEYEKAAAAYERAIELSPDDPRTNLYLSDIYGKLGDGEKSQKLRQRARQLVEEAQNP